MRADRPATRALALWSRSCSAPSDGLCISHEPASAAHCGADSARTLVVHARSAPDVLAARTQLAALATGAHSFWARSDEAMAKLALADDELERYLALRFPTGLDFGPDGSSKDESIRRFDAWIRGKTEMAEHLRARYLEIAGLDDPSASIVATSRIGLISESFSEALFTAEIPVDVRSGEFAQDKIDAYCDALTTVAESLDTPANDAYASCLTRARALGHGAHLREAFDAAGPCLDALTRSRPETFPRVDEVFDAPERTRMQLQLGIVDDVDAGASYDRQNTRGVALRIANDFAGARTAYEQAFALDSSRPEAAFNLGILETFESNKDNDPDQRVALEGAVEHYRRAVEWFRRAAAHATGALRNDATARAQDARKAIAQLEAFVATLQPETQGDPHQQQ